jgi:hypothetical protein
MSICCKRIVVTVGSTIVLKSPRMLHKGMGYFVCTEVPECKIIVVISIKLIKAMEQSPS